MGVSSGDGLQGPAPAPPGERRELSRRDAASSRDWDIEEHEGSFAKYMQAKNDKLRIQFSKRRRTEGNGSLLFAGVCIHVNGYTKPSHQELKDLMAEYGGSFENYFSNKRVTHIICSNLTDAKLKQYGKERNPVPVVHPDWILECIRAQMLLPFSDFILERIRLPRNQSTLSRQVAGTARQASPAPAIPEGSANAGGGAAARGGDGGGAGGRDAGGKNGAGASGVGEGRPSDATCGVGNSNSNGKASLPIRREKDFVDTFFSNSRLHFIGSWKANIDGVMSAALALNKSPQPLPATECKVRQIIHVDIDCFFASVATIVNPALEGKPVAVCHSDHSNGTAEISSANYEARKFGIKAGMFMSKAKELCPQLVRVPYYFEKYQEISRALYRILLRFSAQVQPISVDEAFVDVSGLGDSMAICQEVRACFAKETGITVSAGASHNMLLARIATKRAKPNGAFLVPSDAAEAFIGELPVGEIPGVGYKFSKRLAEMHIHKCSDVWRHTRDHLQQSLGAKTGELIWEYAHGRDKRQVEAVRKRHSVGAEINWGIRFTTNDEAVKTLSRLSEEVEKRLRQNGKKGRCIAVKVKQRKANAPEPRKFMGHGWCENLSRSLTLACPTLAREVIAKEAISLLLSLRIEPSEIRGLGIQITKLEDLGPGGNGKEGLHHQHQQQHQQQPGIQEVLMQKRQDAKSPATSERHSEAHQQRSPGLEETLTRSTSKTRPISTALGDVGGGGNRSPAKRSAASRKLCFFKEKGKVAVAPITLHAQAGPSTRGGGGESFLPSARDIDLGVLAELPLEMQRELKQAYGIKSLRDGKPKRLANSGAKFSAASASKFSFSRAAEAAAEEEEKEGEEELQSPAVPAPPPPEQEKEDQAVFLDLKRSLDSARYAYEMKEALVARGWTKTNLVERYAVETVGENVERAARLLRALGLLRRDGKQEEREQWGEALEAKIRAEAKRLYGGTL